MAQITKHNPSSDPHRVSGKPESKHAYQNPQLPVEQRVADLLQRMTLEEKVAQMHSFGPSSGLPPEESILDKDGNFSSEKAEPYFRKGIGQLGRPSQKRSPGQAALFTNAVQKHLIENTRLGIPALFSEEILHGLMAYRATSFPQAIALASTWDVALVEEVFTVAAVETRSRGSNYGFTPVLDLARDPRWGRTEETYGEDPFLVSRMGVAAIRGLQGGGEQIDKRHVLATAKHYAVHGQPEGGTNAAPGNFSERIIREQFLPPFRSAITEAKAGCVMASYNEIDGIPAHINHWLLKQVLRGEWGFQGFVTSDGGAIPELVNLHHVAANKEDAARLALEAGIDMEIPDKGCFDSLVRQVQDGRVKEEQVDRAVARILRAKFLLGLFDDPYVDPEEAERLNNCAQHRALALKAAHKAIILLKNQENLLPLAREDIKSIAVIGPNAADLHLGGYSDDPSLGVSILQGIQNKVGKQIRVSYAEGCRITTGKQGWEAWWQDEVQASDPEEDTARIAQAVELAMTSDVAVVVIGGNEATCREAWASNHLGDRDSLDMLGRQEELVDAVLETGTPTVVVLINGRPLSIPSIADKAPAILEGWYLGQESGKAISDVLFGDVNPGGKLPITFPRSVGQLPIYYYQKPSAKRGYLFSDSRPLFPFGHGLSYTTFEYSNLQVTPQRIRPEEMTIVRVDVTNTGRLAGDEVVQLYIRDQVSSLTRPVKELKGFERITLLAGETRRVEFQLASEQLSFLDQNMQLVVEPGLFDVMVGGSSTQVECVVLEVMGD